MRDGRTSRHGFRDRAASFYREPGSFGGCFNGPETGGVGRAILEDEGRPSDGGTNSAGVIPRGNTGGGSVVKWAGSELRWRMEKRCHLWHTARKCLTRRPVASVILTSNKVLTVLRPYNKLRYRT